MDELLKELLERAGLLDQATLGRREPWMWRYRELLPLDGFAELPPFQVGMTPIFGAPRVAAWAGVAGLWIKDEGRGPTGTPFDRGAAVAAAEAKALEKRGLSRATTTEAEARAFRCWAASMELAHAPLMAEGWYDASDRNRSVRDGYSTLGYEIGEQLAERMPEWVVLADPNGTWAPLVDRGLRLFRELGFYRTAARVLGVESDSGDVSDARDALEASGILAGPLGARGLAGLKVAVAAGEIDSEATVLLVTDGGVASERACPLSLKPVSR